MKIQAVHRRKKASAFVETRRKERAELEAAMANMTEEEKEALRMKKGSDREKLEAAAVMDMHYRESSDEEDWVHAAEEEEASASGVVHADHE